MKTVLIGVALCALTACTTSGMRPEAQWEAYRAQVVHDEESGVLSASQAQERLRDGWTNIYGKDPNMAGYFAYSETLMRSAEQGHLSMAEAKELVKAREREAWSEYQTAKRHRQDVVHSDYDL
jgi:hypothetical protein